MSGYRLVIPGSLVIEDGDLAENAARALHSALVHDIPGLQDGDIHLIDEEGAFAMAPMADGQTMYRNGYG